MDTEAVKNVVQSLPTSAVTELLNIGVCPMCIFRIFGVHGDVYLSNIFSAVSFRSLLSTTFESQDSQNKENNDEHATKELIVTEEICTLCLGILQMLCHHESHERIANNETDKTSDFVNFISKILEGEDHQFKNFCLEVSIPAAILLREHAIWLYVKEKFKIEDWVEDVGLRDCATVKDVLKFILTKCIENRLGRHSDCNSSFRIALIYKHEESPSEPDSIRTSKENNRKQTKIGDNGNSHKDILTTIEATRATVNGESFSTVQRTLSSISDDNFLEKYECPPKKLHRPCQFVCICFRTAIYIGGRYLKYSRNVSQTCWIIDDERMGEASVEEIIGDAILPFLKADRYKFHAAGREDIDVRMLGSGRPFLFEVHNAHLIPTKADLIELEKMINKSRHGIVNVKDLKVVGNEAWDIMKEGEAEKQKQYAAVVWISRNLSEVDTKILSDTKELEIDQKTPVRVLHRRSPLVRKRLIHWMKFERIEGSRQYFLLHLCTQAGTYIKEFVHGDLGRTSPSIGSLLGCVAEIVQLDVTDVKMECFM